MNYELRITNYELECSRWERFCLMLIWGVLLKASARKRLGGYCAWALFVIRLLKQAIRDYNQGLKSRSFLCWLKAS